MASCYHPDGTDDHNVFRGTGTEFAQWVVDTLPHFAGHHALHRAAPHPATTATAPRSTPTASPTTCRRPDDDGQQTDMVLGLRYVDRFERRDGDAG